MRILTVPLIIGLLFFAGAAYAQPAPSPSVQPDQSFFAAKLYFPTVAGNPTTMSSLADTNVVTGDFISELKPGQWSQDKSIPGAWIYRISSTDQLTGNTTDLGFLLQPPSDNPNVIELARLIFNQQEVPSDQFASIWKSQIAAVLDQEPVLPDSLTTPWGILSTDPSNRALFDGKPFVGNPQGNESLNFVKLFQNDVVSDIVVAEDVGGDACPALYYVIYISGYGANALGAFGNCKEASSIAMNENNIVLTIGPDTYVVDGVIVTKNGTQIKMEAPF